MPTQIRVVTFAAISIFTLSLHCASVGADDSEKKKAESETQWTAKPLVLSMPGKNLSPGGTVGINYTSAPVQDANHHIEAKLEAGAAGIHPLVDAKMNVVSAEQAPSSGHSIKVEWRGLGVRATPTTLKVNGLVGGGVTAKIGPLELRGYVDLNSFQFDLTNLQHGAAGSFGYNPIVGASAKALIGDWVSISGGCEAGAYVFGSDKNTMLGSTQRGEAALAVGNKVFSAGPTIEYNRIAYDVENKEGAYQFTDVGHHAPESIVVGLGVQGTF